MKRYVTFVLSLTVLLSALLSVTALSANFADTEKALIEASKSESISVGIIDNSAPVCYWNDSDAAYEGITIDMLNAISQKTGLCFKYSSVDLSRRSEATNPKEDSPDLVAGIVNCDNLPDKRGWLLSDGLHVDSLVVVGLGGADLASEKTEKKVAIMAEFVMASEYVKLKMPEYKAVEYPTCEECLDAVVQGEADAAVYLRSCISYLMQKPYYSKLEFVPTYSESVDVCVAGFTAESKPLIDIINKGLTEVSEKESRSIALNYTVLNPYQLTLKDVLYKYRVMLIIILALVLSVIAVLTVLASVRRRNAEKMKEVLAIAEKANAAKSSFMSRMSHEIRTPLNAVIGYNTIARNDMNEAITDADRRQAEMKVMDCLTKSDMATKHLLATISDVLDMAAIENGKITVFEERFDFKNLTASLTAIFYAQAKSKGVEFDVQFDQNVDEWIIGDQMRVNQILSNLLSNAIKFTPEGGTVTLFIRPKTDDDEIHIHFEVRDTGIGMSSEFKERIWMPFEQADESISRRFGGTGLGLAITKNLVELLGGTISVNSTLGKGTTFTLELTFKRTDQPQGNSLYDFTGINALIVDDDINTCDYIRLLLNRSGVRSMAATSGEEALLAIEEALEKDDPYTVCLVDWRMPKMDGLETIKRIRDIVGDKLPIIVITAYDFSDIADRAVELGVNMFISKPLFQSSLFNLLANISGRKAPKNTERLSAYHLKGFRVMLAEDNAMNMEIANRILLASGLEVDCVKDGQKAVELFEESPVGTYQAILMDVQMPVMDGYNATKIIRQSTHPEAKTIPIIAMTADAFSENIAESLSVGMNAHISKPIDIQVLFDTLQKYILPQNKGE